MRTVELIIFWLLLLDSVSCNFIFWFGRKWYVHHFRTISRVFPPSKGWAAVYLVAVLLLGFLLLSSQG